MFPAGKHPLFPYTEDDRRTVLNNLCVTESQLRTDVESITTWVQKQPHLAEAGIDPRVAEKFILLAKGSVERAKRRIEYLYKERAKIPEITGRIKVLENGTTVWDTHVMAIAPKLLNGARITFLKVFDWEKFTFENAGRNIFMLTDIRLYNDLGSSEIWIADAENLAMAQYLRFNLLTFSRGCCFLQNSLGVRVSSIHLVNCKSSSIMQTVMNVCKPLVSKKVLERLKFHDSIEGVREYIPNEYLPEDYGGDLPSFAVYKEIMEEVITSEKTKQFLMNCCKLVSDESKRVKSEYNEDCLQGNFKKLEFD